MPEFLGGGLVFEDILPLAWAPGPLPQGVVRVQEALKDESPALLHELQRLEFKLNVLLRLTSELAKRSHSLPPPRHIRLSSGGLEWIGEDAPAMGSAGILDLYINTTLPQPLRLPATVVGRRPDPKSAAAQMQFSGLNDHVVDLIEKLIFRHHRRLVAGSRLSPNSRP